jgi:hypothetical protein
MFQRIKVFAIYNIIIVLTPTNLDGYINITEICFQTLFVPSGSVVVVIIVSLQIPIFSHTVWGGSPFTRASIISGNFSSIILLQVF